MFGEEQIIGEKEVKISKNRIQIPAFTGIEPKEELGYLYDLKKTKLLIYKLKEQEKEIVRRLSILDKLYEEGTINYKEKLKLRRYICGVLSFMSEKVDASCRLTLEYRIIDDVLKNETAYIVGVDNHIEIYDSKETYELSKSK